LRRALLLATLVVAACATAPSACRADEDPDREESLPFYVPSQAKLQFAGNIGLLSAGGGWSWWHRTVDLDLLFGWVPPMQGDDPIYIGTLKVTGWPVELDLGDDWNLRPISAGGTVSLTFGDDYWIFLPDRYPSKYYWASSAVRFGAFVGGSVGRSYGVPRNVDFYWEVGVTDLELWIFLENPRQITFWDVLHVALGVSVGF